MSFQLNLPPSAIRKMAAAAEPVDGEGEAEGEPQDAGKKREDWKKLKELEEARKAGTAPAMKDEEGRDINPHIPQYIMQAPWYFGAEQATLRHQRQQEDKLKDFSKGWYKRGVKDGPVATKFRKGACENCGAVTHKKKDCLERPRKIGARFTGQDMAPDEHIQDTFEFDYDGKRDRWNGYDAADHKRIVEDFHKIDEAKRLLKAQRVEDAVENGELAPEEAKKVVDGEEEEEDEDKYADDVDMPGQKFETKQRITVRNLRIREDTAKYLYNLNVDSAYYDPKTRAMRDNPFKNTGKEPKDLPYAGDNFTRWTGEAMDIAKQQLFAWEAYEKGSEVNLQADPTKLDMLTREYSKKKDDYKQSMKDSILEKYGGQEHLQPADKQLLAQSEEYVEYSRTGSVIKGQERAKVKSRYLEDVYSNNHTCVWGSFWKDGQWGYKCCYSLLRESYCTGQAGKQDEQKSIISPETQKGPVLSPDKADKTSPLKAIMPAGDIQQNIEAASEEEEEKVELTEKQLRKLRKKEKKKRKKQKEKERKRKKKKRKHSSSESESSDSESEDEATKREKRILEAIRREEERLEEVDRMMMVDERKRSYNVTYDFKPPTEDDIEAYQRKRRRDEDPMADFV